MRTLLAGLVVAGLALTVSPALGQAAELPAIEISPAIAVRMHWIQYSMISGRIVAASGLSVPHTRVQSPRRRSQRRETLSIEVAGGVCGMEYHLDSTGDQLRIVLRDDALSIHRTRAGDGYRLEFQYRPEEPLSLVVVEGDSRRRLQADGFWQLYLAEPEVVRAHLVPLLELLHPSWQLTETGAEIEDTLVHTQHAASRTQPDRQRWSRLVDALGSPKFAERETAQRALHTAGQVVVPYLQSLDRGRLDAEQVSRVRAVVEALSVDYEDRVERVAAWLADDARVWLALLARNEPARRRIAVEQLNRLLGEPIDFDPDAPAEERQQAIERLQRRLARTEQVKRAQE